MKHIKLVKAKTFELDPDKFYMAFINFPKSGLTKEDLSNVQVPGEARGNFIWVLIGDDPNDVIDIVEVQPE